MVKIISQQEAAKQLTEAMKTNDESKIQVAWEAFSGSVAAQVKADYEEMQDSNDKAVLASRGYRQLTAVETKFYEKFIEAAKSGNPKQAFTDLIDIDNGMPTTIIEDVYKDLREERPLLGKIKFQYVKYLTKWLLNDHVADMAVWGEITDEITKEITSAFRTLQLDQAKLSAYAIIEMGMLDLGPAFLDGYIRTILKEALAYGLEYAIVTGNGVNCPVGFDRDIHEGVSYSTTTGYPRKTPVAVTSFEPAEYGALVAKLATNERGKKKSFGGVMIICNQTDYLTKIMPATTVLNSSGVYVNNLFPFKTDAVISNVLADGEAILCLPEEYFMGVGGPKDGTIEYSDDFKFLEDKRTYKIKQYGQGRCIDNTSAILLDISALEAAYISVKSIPSA